MLAQCETGHSDAQSAGCALGVIAIDSKDPEEFPGLRIPELVRLPITVPEPFNVAPCATVTIEDVSDPLTVNVPASTSADTGAVIS